MNRNRLIIQARRATLLAGILPLVACDNGNSPEAVAAVTVSLASSQIILGRTMQATAVLVSADGSPLSGRTVSWESTDPEVASISGTGTTATITAVSLGAAAIIARSEGISGMSPFLTVLPFPDALQSLTATPETVTLPKIGTTQLITTTAVLSPGATFDCVSVSNNTAVVTVTQRGPNPTITAVWPGGATIIINCTGSGAGLTENVLTRYVQVIVID